MNPLVHRREELEATWLAMDARTRSRLHYLIVAAACDGVPAKLPPPQDDNGERCALRLAEDWLADPAPERAYAAGPYAHLEWMDGGLRYYSDYGTDFMRPADACFAGGCAAGGERGVHAAGRTGTADGRACGAGGPERNRSGRPHANTAGRGLKTRRTGWALAPVACLAIVFAAAPDACVAAAAMALSDCPDAGPEAICARLELPGTDGPTTALARYLGSGNGDAPRFWEVELRTPGAPRTAPWSVEDYGPGNWSRGANGELVHWYSHWRQDIEFGRMPGRYWVALPFVPGPGGLVATREYPSLRRRYTQAFRRERHAACALPWPLACNQAWRARATVQPRPDLPPFDACRGLSCVDLDDDWQACACAQSGLEDYRLLLLDGARLVGQSSTLRWGLETLDVLGAQALPPDKPQALRADLDGDGADDWLLALRTGVGGSSLPVGLWRLFAFRGTGKRIDTATVAAVELEVEDFGPDAWIPDAHGGYLLATRWHVSQGGLEFAAKRLRFDGLAWQPVALPELRRRYTQRFAHERLQCLRRMPASLACPATWLSAQPTP